MLEVINEVRTLIIAAVTVSVTATVLITAFVLTRRAANNL
jgi:hypothetical protein